MRELRRLLAGRSLFIFDLDGTLVDSSPLHARAFNAAFARYGIEVEYPRIAGLTTDAAVAKVLSDAQLELSPGARAALAKDKQEHARELIAEELEPVPGAPAFLTASKGRRLALCTSGSRATVEGSLGRLGWRGIFDPVVTAENVRRGKPEPECYLQVLKSARERAERALVFEDADSGVAAAAAAGLDAVRITAPGAAPGYTWPQLTRALLSLAA